MELEENPVFAGTWPISNTFGSHSTFLTVRTVRRRREQLRKAWNTARFGYSSRVGLRSPPQTRLRPSPSCPCPISPPDCVATPLPKYRLDGSCQASYNRRSQERDANSRALLRHQVTDHSQPKDAPEYGTLGFSAEGGERGRGPWCRQYLDGATIYPQQYWRR